MLPCGIYFLLPDRKIWYLVLVYFADIIIFGGLYVTIGNRSRSRYHDALKQGREIRNLLNSNEKKIKVITHSIEKDGNEDIYDLLERLMPGRRCLIYAAKKKRCHQQL